MKELKGFRRVWLAPSETRTVTFDITFAMLSFYDAHTKYTVEPGDFEIMIGTSSRDDDLQKVVLAVQGASQRYKNFPSSRRPATALTTAQPPSSFRR